MSAHFDHFIQLLPPGTTSLRDLLPGNLQYPRERHAAMPVIAGDTLRFLVPYSILGHYPLPDINRLSLFWINAAKPKNNFRLSPVGKLRVQDGANYSEIRLRISAAPQPGQWRQFAICYTDATGKEVPVLGTFRGQQATMAEYVDAVRSHYANYPYTPVTVDVKGNELLIRAFHSDRFRLGHVPLHIGLGDVLPVNPNQPTFTLQFAGSVALAAQDVYRVVVLDDIEEGNIFSLNGVRYVATGIEAPSDILAALGVPNGLLQVPVGQSPASGLTPGSYVSNNNNQPGIQLFYDAVDGSNDTYIVNVADSVTTGNVFQIAVDGQATKTKVAVEGDTRASIEAYFKNAIGNTRFACPNGKIPVASAVAGTRTTQNTNQAGLIVSLKETKPARTVNRYVSQIGNSIRKGNRFFLGSTAISAPSNQSKPADVAALLGQPTYPFALDLDPSTAVPMAYAEPGPAYNVDDHLSAVELLAGSLWRPNSPLVAELTIPADATSGFYQLALAESPSADDLTAGVLRSVLISTYLKVVPSALDTMLLVYGPGDVPGRTMGYEYHEPGLMQQVRVPVALSLGKQRQTESLATGLDRVTFRTSATAERMLTLITEAQPEVFHRSLLAALKHRQVYLIDPRNPRRIAYRCEGEYQQTNIDGSRWLQQGQASLIQLNTLIEFTAPGVFGGLLRGAEADNQANGLITVDQIDVPGGIPVYLENSKTGMVRQIWPGSLLSPGAYRLRVRCGHDALRVGIYVNSILSLQTALSPGKLNRTDEELILASEASLSILALPQSALYQSQDPAELPRVPLVTEIVSRQHPAGSAFSNEYNPDFN